MEELEAAVIGDFVTVEAIKVYSYVLKLITILVI